MALPHPVIQLNAFLSSPVTAMPTGPSSASISSSITCGCWIGAIMLAAGDRRPGSRAEEPGGEPGRSTGARTSPPGTVLDRKLGGGEHRICRAYAAADLVAARDGNCGGSGWRVGIARDRGCLRQRNGPEKRAIASPLTRYKKGQHSPSQQLAQVTRDSEDRFLSSGAGIPAHRRERLGSARAIAPPSHGRLEAKTTGSKQAPRPSGGLVRESNRCCRKAFFRSKPNAEAPFPRSRAFMIPLPPLSSILPAYETQPPSCS